MDNAEGVQVLDGADEVGGHFQDFIFGEGLLVDSAFLDEIGRAGITFARSP